MLVYKPGPHTFQGVPVTQLRHEDSQICGTSMYSMPFSRCSICVLLSVFRALRSSITRLRRLASFSAVSVMSTEHSGHSSSSACIAWNSLSWLSSYTSAQLLCYKVTDPGTRCHITYQLRTQTRTCSHGKALMHISFLYTAET